MGREDVGKGGRRKEGRERKGGRRGVWTPQLFLDDSNTAIKR